MTWESFWASMGLSAVWAAVLALVNALLNGLVPLWVCGVLGLVFGFLSTMIFVAVRRTDGDGGRHRSDGTGTWEGPEWPGSFWD